LPIASALPVLIVADPPDAVDAPPLLDARPLGASAFWIRPAVFVDVLPVAVFCPVVATPRPALVMVPSWSSTSTPEAEPDWLSRLTDCEPIAVASPVVIDAAPSDTLPASPELLAGPSTPFASCVVVDSLSDSLPVAVFRPVSATATPMFSIPAF
jgi:hypothetical protein